MTKKKKDPKISIEKLKTIVLEMQSSPNLKGREVHRRKRLIDFLAHFNFKNYLEDVGQKKKRPDVRYFSEDVSPSNGMSAPFIVETKDFGELSEFENLPFRQLCYYITRNCSRLVGFAVTDFEWWYRFEFDANHQLYFELLNFARSFSESEEQWTLGGGNSAAIKLFEPFLASAPFRFSKICSSGTKSLENALRNSFNSGILHRSAPILESNVTKTSSSVEEIAEQLGRLMSPLVEKAVKIILNDLDSSNRAKSRFKMWLKQQGNCSVPFLKLISSDRNVEENKMFEEKGSEFAWLSSYSILNLLYFVRGLEERSLISPIINSSSVRENPNLFFSVLWEQTESDSLKHFADFIRLQKVYCDWLIPKLPAGQMGELVRFIGSASGFSTSQPDLLGSLYEQLMQNLDTASRRKLGQYYTPKPIAELLWQVAREGLQDAKIHAQEITTLDPGCGSGMLLCRGVDLLLGEIKPTEKSLGSSVRDLATRNINGFEINPLSSAIARINLFFTYIDQIKQRNGDPVSQFVKKVSISEIPIFNTDAYDISEEVSDELEKLSELEDQDILALKREALFLKRTKDRSDYILLIGNPPYCGSDESVSDGRANHLRVWNGQYAKRNPNSGIREAFLHFMGLAHTVLKKGGRGMIAFVTSDTWLQNHDHEIVRRFFLRNYDFHGIVFLGPGMFPGLKVSTSLVIMQLREDPIEDSAVEDVKVPVYSFGKNTSVAERYVEISEILSGKKKIKWNMVRPDEYACIRAHEKGDLQFSKGFVKIPALFRLEFQTCKTGADPFLTSAEPDELRKRVRKILGTNEDVPPDANISGKNNKTKLARLRKIRDKESLTYNSAAYKTFIKYSGSRDVFGVPKERVHTVYFEPELLDRPVVISKKTKDNKPLSWVPHEATLKLVYNSHEVPLRCFVIENSSYVHRWGHLRFAPPEVPTWVAEKKSNDTKMTSNLTTIGKEYVSNFETIKQMYYFISGWINSDFVSSGFQSLARGQEAPLPFSAALAKNNKEAKAISLIAQALTEMEAKERLLSETEVHKLYSGIKEVCSSFKGPKSIGNLNSDLKSDLNSLCERIYKTACGLAKAA